MRATPPMVGLILALSALPLAAAPANTVKMSQDGQCYGPSDAGYANASTAAVFLDMDSCQDYRARQGGTPAAPREAVIVDSPDLWISSDLQQPVPIAPKPTIDPAITASRTYPRDAPWSTAPMGCFHDTDPESDEVTVLQDLGTSYQYFGTDTAMPGYKAGKDAPGKDGAGRVGCTYHVPSTPHTYVDDAYFGR